MLAQTIKFLIAFSRALGIKISINLFAVQVMMISITGSTWIKENFICSW